MPRHSTAELATKRCRSCSLVKPLTDFRTVKNGRVKFRCKDCDRLYMKAYYEKNKHLWDAAREKYRDRRNAKRREVYRNDESLRSSIIAKTREYNRRNPDRKRNSRLRLSYGITVETYTEMLESQGGGCAICGQKPVADGRSLHVDHEHATGRIRGLLCSSCNLGIGKFRDDVALLMAAAAYLGREVQ